MFGLFGNGKPIEEVKEELAKEEAIIIDVREEDEVTEGHVADAYWVPLSELSSNPDPHLDKLEELSANKTIYCYCKSGGRSQKVADLLGTHGLKSQNLGGFGQVAADLETATGIPKKKF